MQLKHGSCENMFINEQWDDIHHLYTLFGQTEDGTTELEKKFKEHIEEIHRCSISKLQALPQQLFMKELCNLRDKYSQTVADICKGNMQLQTAVNNFCRDAVNSVCENMFINKQWDDVHHLYTLLGQTEDGTTELEQKFKEHIEEIHRCSIPKLQALPQQLFMKELCNLHDKYSQIVADIFKGNMQLQTAVNNFCRDAVNSVCENMFINKQWDDVHHLYTLLGQTEDGTTELEQKFKEHIEEIHRCSIPKLQALPQQQFTTELCYLHDKYTQIAANIFKGNMQLQTAVNNFCRDAVNSVKTPELLVSHCDLLLNKMSQSNSNAKEGIEQFVTVFQYTDNKYVYQSLYSKHLTRRLLQSGPISLHTERSMIDILKDKCGFEYTRIFQEMLKDITTSAKLMTEFSNFVNPKENELRIQLSIKILQPYAWPLAQNALPCSLPFELKKPMQLIGQFYHGKFSGRKLAWMHSLGYAEVELLYLKKKYIVCLGNSYQLALLLSCEEHDVISTEVLATNTQLPEQEVLRQLQSLVNAKLL